MNLDIISAPLPKATLVGNFTNLGAEDFKVETIEATQIRTDLLVLEEVKSVPNAPVGTTTFFSNGLGVLSQTDDVGNSVNYATSDQTGNTAVLVTGLENQISGVAPTGQRDLWNNDSNGTHLLVAAYDPVRGIAWGTEDPNVAAGVQYSVDGGKTFSACSFDVAPTDYTIVGFGGSLVIAYSSVGEYYTSVDGINFVKRGVNGTSSQTYSLGYFGGLFINANANAGGDADRIQTSGDGIVWTNRSCSILPYAFASNSEICVGLSKDAPYVVTSNDGKTWTETKSTLTEGGWSVAWNGTEFMILTQTSGLVYTSSDGLNWIEKGALGPTNNIAGLIWAQGRWYATIKDGAGNYSLTSTPQSDLPFVGTYLDGAIVISGSDNFLLVYCADRGTFILSYYQYGVSYSTLRNTSIKSLGDAIRVRGMAVNCSKYSTYSTVSVGGTTTETLISNPANALGSLFFQAPQVGGMVIDLDNYLSISSSPGDTLTLRYKVNGSTAWSHVLTIPSIGSPTSFTVKSHMVSLGLGGLMFVHSESDSYTTTKINTNISWAPGVQNTITVTAQWGGTASTVVMDQMSCKVMFPNGA